jgi:uncharacterized protein (TIGR02996 family)
VTEAAFLDAIADRPHDNTLRLVYADWLDENDRPECAAFLRGEVWLWTQTDRSPGWFRQIREFLRAARSTPDDWREAVSRPRLAGTTWRWVEPLGSGDWVEEIRFYPDGVLGYRDEQRDDDRAGRWRRWGPRVELVIHDYSLHHGTIRGDTLLLRGHALKDPPAVWVWAPTRVPGPDCLPNLS